MYRSALTLAIGGMFSTLSFTIESQGSAAEQMLNAQQSIEAAARALEVRSADDRHYTPQVTNPPAEPGAFKCEPLKAA